MEYNSWIVERQNCLQLTTLNKITARQSDRENWSLCGLTNLNNFVGSGAMTVPG